MPSDANARDDLSAALADPEAAWSLGAFGAAAEFRRRPDEPCEPLGGGRFGLRTGRGGIELVLPDALRLIAYETPVGDGWSHALALCLPAAALDPAPRTESGEIGPDQGALDPARRDAVLFDLGLDAAQVSVRVRTRDAGTLARLRARLGATAPDFDAAILPEVAGGRADLVFAGPLGRIEVLAGGLGDPSGPRAYALPRILRLRRTHAATAPIPPGLVPCAHLYPPHPCRDRAGRPIPFDRARHDAFQALLARWGDRPAFALKQALLRLTATARAASEPVSITDRRGRAVARVAGAQAERLGR